MFNSQLVIASAYFTQRYYAVILSSARQDSNQSPVDPESGTLHTQLPGLTMDAFNMARSKYRHERIWPSSIRQRPDKPAGSSSEALSLMQKGQH